MFTFKKIRAAVAFGLAAGVVMGAMAAVPMQTVKDSAVAGRLVINGKRLFISGMNIAWHQFGSDLNNTTVVDESAFTKYIQDVRKAGGNAVRWWLHNDASYCPKINSSGQVTGLATNSIKSMRRVLDIAYDNGVVVAMCLFSHNLVIPGSKSSWSDYNVENNYKLFTNASNMDTYIQNGLNVILDSLGNHPAVMCWEVFNEAEGMINGNWQGMTKSIPFDDIVTFTAKVAVAVHTKTVKMVSTGIHEFNKTDYFPKYTDANLQLKISNSADKPKAYLDFYMAHWYPDFQGIGPDRNPFVTTAASWGLTRPIIIGEFPGMSWGQNTAYNSKNSGTPNSGMTITAAYEYAYNNGYAGALSWAMTDAEKGSLDDPKVNGVTKVGEGTKNGLAKLYADHKSDIEIKNVDIPTLTGDLVMKIQITDLPVLSENWSELFLMKDINLSGKTSITFDIFIPSASGTNLDINVVVKTGNDWTWTEGSKLKLANYTKGSWVTVTAPISDFQDQSALSQTRQILLQIGATGTPYTGAIFINNVKVGSEVISDFDDATPWSTNITASSADGKIAISVVTKASVDGNSTAINGGNPASSANRAPLATVTGKTLKVTAPTHGAAAAETSVKLVNLKGKTVATFRAVGSGTFSLADIPAGNYLAELSSGGKKLGSSRVTVR